MRRTSIRQVFVLKLLLHSCPFNWLKWVKLAWSMVCSFMGTPRSTFSYFFFFKSHTTLKVCSFYLYLLNLRAVSIEVMHLQQWAPHGWPPEVKASVKPISFNQTCICLITGACMSWEALKWRNIILFREDSLTFIILVILSLEGKFCTYLIFYTSYFFLTSHITNAIVE